MFNNVDFLFYYQHSQCILERPHAWYFQIRRDIFQLQNHNELYRVKLGRWHKSALADLQNKLLDHSLSKSSIVSGQQEWAKLKKIISELP